MDTKDGVPRLIMVRATPAETREEQIYPVSGLSLLPRTMEWSPVFYLADLLEQPFQAGP